MVYFKRILGILFLLLILTACSENIDQSILKSKLPSFNEQILNGDLSKFFVDKEFTLSQKETYPFEKIEGKIIYATDFNLSINVNEEFEQLTKIEKENIVKRTFETLGLTNIGTNCGIKEDHACFISGLEFQYENKRYVITLKDKKVEVFE
ncbi:hypothetical protein CIB95_02115 [Lottiidibacillus patelloidae]|uniref:Lipoprotein n=1 Tax=Lottiidibacillus patelloidae TaxID=2670334 RepID=A0A263BYM7_9BACI|nr:hypothetical protein [Lottiidibacillus patelloidae]OZM58387.1 hypothetical protein CIB95_02115 [Lottiidibacillus patelloidae]